MGRRLVGPESYRSKFRIFGIGSSHHGGAVLRQQLATQQASATLAAACYNQLQVKHCKRIALHLLTHMLPIFYHTYYIHVWNVFYLHFLFHLSEPSDNAHIQCVVQYTHAAMLRQQHRNTPST